MRKAVSLLELSLQLMFTSRALPESRSASAEGRSGTTGSTSIVRHAVNSEESDPLRAAIRYRCTPTPGASAYVVALDAAAKTVAAPHVPLLSCV